MTDHITAWRIADARFPIVSGKGSAIQGARWNSTGREAIYASLTYACAILEILANSNIGRIPKNHQYVKISIPKTIKIEEPQPDQIKNWDRNDYYASKKYGDKWLDENRSAVLIVPSMTAKNIEKNVIINPLHKDYGKIIFSKPEPVIWDKRLFRP